MPTTPRLGLHYPEGTDDADVPADNGLLANGIDQAATWDMGAVASRPAAGLPGRFWFDPATGLLSVDVGTDWRVLNAAPVETAGTLKLTANSVPDAGYLMCDGSAQSRTAFPDLFAKIGTTFGPGNGTTTFNLPDYRDRALMGAGPTNALGTQPGSASHTHQVPAHAHFVPAHSHAVPAHSHTCGATPNFIYVNWHGGDPDYFAVSGHTHPIDGGATNTLPQARFSTENTGPLVTDATSNLQPSATLNVQIKT